jgi:hypothetical protein
METFLTLGGRVKCIQCNSLSKRTQQRCKAPAIKGKTKCRFHGGKSTGPKTAEGRAKIAAVHTIHGRETKKIRAERSLKLAEIHHLEQLGYECGLFTKDAPRLSGRKPKTYHHDPT